MPTKVLDKGSVELIDCMGSDLTVVNCARVSFDSESTWELDDVTKERRLSKRDTSLIYFLARGMSSQEWQELIAEFCAISDPVQMEKMMLYFNRKAQHWAPFAHPMVQLRVKAPLFVARQLFKHKVGFQESEVSLRYITHDGERYEPDVWRGVPPEGVKQGSSGVVKLSELFLDLLEDDRQAIEHDYHQLLKAGVAPEMARIELPMATYTTWIWTASLAAIARMYNQRSDPHAQWESQQYAHAIGDIMKDLFPVSWEALTG